VATSFTFISNCGSFRKTCLLPSTTTVSWLLMISSFFDSGLTRTATKMLLLPSFICRFSSAISTFSLAAISDRL